MPLISAPIYNVRLGETHLCLYQQQYFDLTNLPKLYIVHSSEIKKKRGIHPLHLNNRHEMESEGKTNTLMASAFSWTFKNVKSNKTIKFVDIILISFMPGFLFLFLIILIKL